MIGNKRIAALCTCRIQDKESHSFISKLEEMLDSIDFGMIIYNCCSCVQKGSEDTDAQLSVFGLIDTSVVDAVIVQADRFNNTEVCRKIIEDSLAKELPVIVLGYVFEHCFNITYKHQDGFTEIVSHLIKQHGIKDLHMLAGFRGNIYSEERIEAFRQVLLENGLPFDESMVSYGDFWSLPAQEAVKKLIAEKRVPKALVCANDNMAIAAVAVLNENGISVPDDVVVTGYDHIDAIYSSSPTITSAFISPEASAGAVCDALSGIFSGGRREGSVVLASSMVVNGSCGCREGRRTNAALALSEQHGSFTFFQDQNIELSANGARIQKCTDFEQVFAIMEECGIMHSMSCFLRTECIDEKTDLNGIGRESAGGSFFQVYDSEPLSRNGASEPHLISFEDIRKEFAQYTLNGYSIVISSLYYLDVPLGFVCFHFKERSFSNYYRIPQIVTVLNNALGGMISLRHTRYLIRQVEEMYRIDPLTGLNNRRGFCIEYDDFLSRNPDSALAVVMCDLDGLKGINDNFGHEAGDIAIQTVAKALKYASGPASVCTRMGGDEMLAVFSCDSKNDECFRSEFESYLAEFNRSSGKKYTVAASVGIYHTKPGDRLSFEELIKCSDVLMYSEKKRRKQRA